MRAGKFEISIDDKNTDVDDCKEESNKIDDIIRNSWNLIFPRSWFSK